jgi:hypothetical protein
MTRIAGLVCLISTVNGRLKKKEKKEEAFLGRPALVAST